MTDRSDPLKEVNFHCRACGARFVAAPARVEEAPEDAYHPWRYFSQCSKCEAEAAQAGWERALLKAWTKATGPRTAEGLAATAKNLEGHPTPEESRRTRFNAMKHGLDAKVATYFPAKPDRYARCRTCEVDRDWCAKQPACVKQHEPFLLYHAAFEQRNPRLLAGIYAETQAVVYGLLNEILLTIVADGAKIESPEYYTDPDGRLIVATYIDETGKRRIIKKIEAHPLFKPLAELLSRNNLSLADMGMTAKVIDDEQEAMGRLRSDEDSRAALAHFGQQTADSVNALRDMLQRAQVNRARDPVLIEHQQDEGA